MGECERSVDLAADDETILAACRVDLFKGSGPGGQHRNKVTTGVRLTHLATGVTAEATESRSQHENRRMAMRRLRMNLACRVRTPFDPAAPPTILDECLFTPRGGSGRGRRRLDLGRRDRRFWALGAVLLDALDAAGGQLSTAAAWADVTTSNLASMLNSDRHLRAAAQQIRKRHGLKPLS